MVKVLVISQEIIHVAVCTKLPIVFQTTNLLNICFPNITQVITACK